MSDQLLRGGEFIISESDIDQVFIPEDMDEEQIMVKDMVLDFVHKELNGRQNKIEHQKELMLSAAELGLVGAHIPENYGGLNMETNTITVITEMLGQAGGSFDTTFAAHTGIGMLPVLYFGTEEVKEKYLPKLCSSELISAYCLTEPGSGSDALAAKSRADLSEDGSFYTITGQKMWISNAGFSDVLIVFAQVDGDKFTGFLVDTNSEGVTLGEEEDKMGIKGSSTRQVFLDNVKVPIGHVLGEVGKGHLIAFNVLNNGRFKLGAMCTGGAKYNIDLSVKYANEREQFGKPISFFGAIKHKLAEQSIRTFALESAVYRVSDMMGKWKKKLIDEGQSIEQATLKAAKEFAAECAIIKIYGSESIDFIADEMVQIFGGNGYSEEYPASPAYRDSRINRIYEGTNEINRMLLVNMVLKKAFKGELDLTGPAWAVQKELTKLPSFSTPSDLLGHAEKAVGNLKKTLLLVAGAAVKYQMDEKINLAHEQEVLMNIADVFISTFIAESVYIRVQKLLDRETDLDNEVYESILAVLLHDLQDRAVKDSCDALASFATGDELRIMLMGVQRFAAFPRQNVKDKRRKIADPMIKSNKYVL